MEEAHLRRRSADRPSRAQIDGAVDRGGGRRRRFPASHALAARRLPLRAPAHHPSPDTLVPAPLPTAPRGISRLPDTDGSKPQRSRFERYPIGFFHLDIAEVRTEQGKLHLFVAIDRTSKFAFVG